MESKPQPAADRHDADNPKDNPEDNREDNHVRVTGIAIFVVFVAVAVWAFPSVRDLSLFESVYVWICSPFVG